MRPVDVVSDLLSVLGWYAAVRGVEPASVEEIDVPGVAIEPGTQAGLGTADGDGMEIVSHLAVSTEGGEVLPESFSQVVQVVAVGSDDLLRSAGDRTLMHEKAQVRDIDNGCAGGHADPWGRYLRLPEMALVSGVSPPHP